MKNDLSEANITI